MSDNMITAYATQSAQAPLEKIEYDAGQLAPEDVEITVESCGLCHSDLSMIDNEWGMSAYPLVPGHEVIGIISKIGDQAKGLSLGQRVGLGWFSASCMHCPPCMDGDHNLCGSVEQTIVARHGGFADKVRAHWSWAIPLPEALDPTKSGPLFCGGITVFNPIVQLGIKPTDKVAVIGIGGLGHMALSFLNNWGCEVTAFTTSPDKAAEAEKLGAHHSLNSRDSGALEQAAGSFDFILSTVNVKLDWNLYIGTLAPKGKLHMVGATLEPMDINAMGLIMGHKSVSGSPLGSPETTRKMLEFCARHSIEPMTESFPMSEVNKALDRLKSGKARYRIVLQADF
jgi:uncharacterized zinc-type alcohol dehydrogenase-like protein